jgi:hypothetical protein
MLTVPAGCGFLPILLKTLVYFISVILSIAFQPFFIEFVTQRIT